MSSLANQKWYIKENAGTAQVRGPIATASLIQYGRQGKLKDRVRVSPDGRRWYGFSMPFSQRSLSSAAIEKALSKILYDSEIDLKFSGPKAGAMPEKKTVHPGIRYTIFAAVAMVIAIAALLPWQLERKRDTESAAPLGPVAAKTTPAAADRVDVEVPETLHVGPIAREDTGPDEATGPIAREDTGPDESDTDPEENTPEVPETSSEPTVTRFQEDLPPDTTPESTPDDKAAEPRTPEKDVRAALQEYYRHLDEVSEQAAQRRDIREAYDLFGKRVQNAEEFLRSQGIDFEPAVLDKIRMENKNDNRYGYFYPANLHDSCEKFSLGIDREAMAEVELQIAGYRQRFADVITARADLQKQKIAMDNAESLLDKMYQNTGGETALKRRSIEDGKKKILDIRQNINKANSRLLDLSQKSLDLSREIQKITKELTPPPLVGYYPEKDWRQIELEQKLARLQHEQEYVLKQVNELHKEVNNRQAEILRLESSIVQWEGELPALENELRNLQRQIDEIAPKQTLLQQGLADCLRTLKPLDDLILRQQEASRVVGEMKQWWAKSNPKPRKNYLMAGYVLKNFSPQYYRVAKKDRGIGGVVEVHYW